MTKSVVTRFAPSPTGFLHIGGVRTAIFNYLWAKHKNGSFKLRIEDTDKKRSTTEAVDAILDGLSWMGLDPAGEVVMQSQNEARHKQVVEELLETGKAYYCYMTSEELKAERETQGMSFKYDNRWRNRPASEAPEGVAPSVRFKMPLEGRTTISDQVQGDVTVNNSELDDLVIQRADGTPTYNLAVVVDDHDMGVTHVIRGDDHLNNAFRQHHIFEGMGWDVPTQAHIPLIHGQDGAKMSKRHGALGVDAYRDMGFLKPAIFNYLLRLGWSHGDEEIFSVEQAIELFDISNVNKAPSRFNMDKLRNLNQHYMKEADPAELLAQLMPFFTAAPDAAALKRIEAGLSGLVPRATDLIELAEGASIYVPELVEVFDDKAKAAINDDSKVVLAKVEKALSGLDNWSYETIEATLKQFAKDEGLKMGAVFMPLRAALTGTMNAPSVPEVAFALGRNLAIKRLKAVV